MKSRPLALAAFALLAVVIMAAAAAASSVTVPIPSSFPISGAGKAVDNASNEYGPGIGPIAFFRGGDTLYVRVPAPARNGTRLATLDDPQNGIAFRNNTMLLPVYASGARAGDGGGAKAGGLIVTTDSLSAECDGFTGRVTGLELGLAAGPEACHGENFTAGAVLLPGDLPADAEYRVTFAVNDTVEKAVASGLGARGQTVAATSPVFGVEAGGRANVGAVGCVIVTIRVDADWARLYGGNNTSLYAYSDGAVSGLRPQVIRTEDGTTYQAVAPGPGQFILAAAGPRGDAVPGTSGGDAAGLAALGGAMIALLAALAVMVRRVTQR